MTLVPGMTLPVKYLLTLISSHVHYHIDPERGRDVPVGTEQDVSRKFSNGDHIGCFLQLDDLLVYERALVVYDNVRIQRTVLGTISPGGSPTSFFINTILLPINLETRD